MFAVIFEVRPKPDRWDDYLALARQLRPKLEAIDGFIDNERFGSKRTAGCLLSLSTWRDEKSVVRWRTQGEHHGVQQTGRNVVFEDYHLRVGEIVSDTAPPHGLSIKEQRFDETETGAAKFCTITEVASLANGAPADQLPGLLGIDIRSGGLVDHEVFESITNPGKLLLLGSWRDGKAAAEWNPMLNGGARDVRHRQVRVIRDYGMFDRGEAPQFHRAVERA